MLLLHNQLRTLSFSSLMQIYEEDNVKNGAYYFPELPPNEQLISAEESFYQYLHDDFFSASGALYCVWAPGGRYTAALRLEPYHDGLLLEALATLPEARRSGHATNLLKAVLAHLAQRGSGRVYSHVHKRNVASLAVHRKCGFMKVSDHAVYVDGSVDQGCYTLCKEY